MATNFLNEFKMNLALNAELKARFDAKWSRINRRWTVTSKVKAEAANKLIDEIVGFEANKFKPISQDEIIFIKMDKILSEKYGPFLQKHPLTGEMWMWTRWSFWAEKQLGKTSEEADAIDNEVNALYAKFYAEQKLAEAEKAATLAAEKQKVEAAKAAALAAIAPQIEAAAKAKAEADAKEAAARAEKYAQIERVIDLNTVRAARSVMGRECKNVGAKARLAYRDAQSIINSARKTLAAAGLRSAGISELAYMNFNRPDRDNPNAVTESQIIDLHAIELEDETEED